MNKKNIASAAKVSPAQVRTIQLNLRKLREEGALVQIHCYGLSVIERKASNAERGVADGDMRAKRISSGRIKTLPSKLCGELLTLRELSRSRLDNPYTSFDITGFRPWRYIPVKRFADWLKGQEELETRWASVKDTCIRSLVAFRNEEEARCREVARRSWLAIWANAEKRAKEVVEVDGKAYTRSDEEVFTDRLIDRALSYIPCAEQIRQMHLTWEVGGIDNRSEVAREVVAEARNEAEADEARADAYLAHQRAIHALRELSSAQREEEIETQQMRAIIAERLREQLSSLPDPGVEMLEQLRGAVGNTTRAVLESLGEKGRLYKGTSTAITGMVDKFEAINPGDEVLEELMARLRVGMARRDGKYDYREVASCLTAIDEVCNKRRLADARLDRAAIEIAALD